MKTYYVLGVLLVSLFAGFFLTADAQVLRILRSDQLAPTPINGYCLQTNGATSTWAPCPSGGGGGGSGTVYLASTSPWTVGNLARVAGNGTLDSIATSSLGLRFTGLTDTQASLNANRVIFTNSLGTALTDNASFVSDGTRLGISTAVLSNGLINIGQNSGAAVGSSSIAIGTTLGSPLYGIRNDSNTNFAIDTITGGVWSQRFNINRNNGNVGISSSTPGGRLVVAGAGTGTGVTFQTTDSNNVPRFSIFDNGAIVPNESLLTLGLMPSAETAGTLRLGRRDGVGRFHEITAFNSASQANNYLDFGLHNATLGATTSVMRLFGNGNVGIGTTSPSARLTISGDMRLTGRFADASSSTGSVGQLLMATAAGTQWVSTSTLGFLPDTIATGTLSTGPSLTVTAGRGVIGGAATVDVAPGFEIPTSTGLSNLFTFYDTPSNRITAGTNLSWSGNTLNATVPAQTVYLATTSPWVTGNLARVASNGAVESIATSSLGLRFTGLTDTQASLSANRIVHTNSAGTALTDTADFVFTGTNLGIGTTSPTYLLSVNGGANNGTKHTKAFFGRPDSAVGVEIGTGDGTANAAFVGSATNFPLLFTVNSTERARFDTSGNFAIGTTSFSNRLHVEGSGATAATFSRNTAASNISVEFRNNTSSWFAGQGATGNFHIETDNALATQPLFTFTPAGSFGIGTGTPSTRFTVAGDMRLTGRFGDSASSTGVSGQVLSSTGAGTAWVSPTIYLATSTGYTTGGLAFATGPGTIGTTPTTTLVAGTGISFTGGTPVILGSSPITIESTGGGGGGAGGGWATTTDGGASVTYASTNAYVGGSASNTAEIVLSQSKGLIRISSSTDANATATVASVNPVATVVIGAGSTTADGGLNIVRGAQFTFGSLTQAVTSFIGGITEWVIQVATTIFQGDVRITGNMKVATTTYYGATTSDAVVVAGYINSGNWIEEFCTSPTAEITQVVADTLRGCGRYAYLEDAAGAIDYVRPTTGSSTYFRIRPGATGVTNAAGDGMAIGWADGLDMGDLQRFRPAMEFALKQDNLGNATATMIFGGITDKVTVGVDAATEPGVGFYVIATSTANWLFACNPATGGTQYYDTGIASSTVATGNVNPWTHFRLEVGGTDNTAVTGLLKWRTQTTRQFNNGQPCTIDLAASTAAAAPIVAIGKSTAGSSPELHVPWVKFWYYNQLY